MYKRTLLLSALAVALLVAPAQAAVTASLVADQDLGQPDMARSLVFSGDAYDNEMGITTSLITYNGHAGLGTSAYQHHQTDLEFLAFSPQGPGFGGLRVASTDSRAPAVKDGTSNTLMF